MDVTQNDLHELLQIFERKSSEAGNCEPGSLEFNALKNCEYLFKLDYSLIELENTNGSLSPRYPGRIFIPEYEHIQMSSTLTASNPNIFGENLKRSCPSLRNEADSIDYTLRHCQNENSMLQSFVTFADKNIDVGGDLTMNGQRLQQKKLPQKHQPQPTVYEDLSDINKIREIITHAKYARCRQRFPVPVIMYGGKYICRSATISLMPETYGRKVVDYAYDCLSGSNYGDQQRTDDDPTEDSLINQMPEPSQFSYDEVIKCDIQLLNAFNVTTIVDLMVENRKIKYFMAVSSSEKADPEKHYEHFKILSLPYPGCEFFKQFRNNNYMAKNLFYDWDDSFNDAPLSVPSRGPLSDLEINWQEYKQWDLIHLTQNYLKAMLKYIQDDNSGLLVHCISGWDRTPLFISLLRLSLWADGAIHQSLTPFQIVYLTLAYDWYLFGHQLPDRIKRGEDIMFFCFHVLKFLMDDDFNIVEFRRKRTKTTSSNGSSNSVLMFKVDCDDEQIFKEDYYDKGSNDSFAYIRSNENMSNIPASPTPSQMTNADSINSVLRPGVSLNGCSNRSPNVKRTKTKPITVPGISPARQRHESVSSNGSWHVVTETGSIDSVKTGSYMRRLISETSDNSHSDGSNSDSMCPANVSPSDSANSSGSIASNHATIQQPHSIKENMNVTGKNYEELCINSCNSTATIRKKRLSAVRAIFIQNYGQTIGLKFREGSSMNLVSFIGNLAELF